MSNACTSLTSLIQWNFHWGYALPRLRHLWEIKPWRPCGRSSRTRKADTGWRWGGCRRGPRLPCIPCMQTLYPKGPYAKEWRRGPPGRPKWPRSGSGSGSGRSWRPTTAAASVKSAPSSGELPDKKWAQVPRRQRRGTCPGNPRCRPAIHRRPLSLAVNPLTVFYFYSPVDDVSVLSTIRVVPSAPSLT